MEVSYSVYAYWRKEECVLFPAGPGTHYKPCFISLKQTGTLLNLQEGHAKAVTSY